MSASNRPGSQHSEQLERMCELVAEGRIEDYYYLTQRLVRTLKGEELGEVYMSRARQKLFMTDLSFADDIARADELLPSGSRFPTISNVFTAYDPHCVILFNPDYDSLSLFRSALKRSTKALNRLFGDYGLYIAQQIESEILYFTGHPREARLIARPLFEAHVRAGRIQLAIMSGYVDLRCCLAGGNIDELGHTLTRIIRIVRSNPREEIIHMYNAVRSWINLTTGWMGDTPRFITTPGGRASPVLEDRMSAVENGISNLGPSELPYKHLAELAGYSYYTLRQFYMDIYDAMVAFKYRSREVGMQHFLHAYRVSHRNNIIMPFAECGMQIVSMVRYVLRHEPEKVIPHEWINRLILMADAYEAGLRKCRGETFERL